MVRHLFLEGGARLTGTSLLENAVQQDNSVIKLSTKEDFHPLGLDRIPGLPLMVLTSLEGHSTYDYEKVAFE